MTGAAQPQVLAGRNVGRMGRAQRDTGRARQHQMRLGEFREFVGADVGRTAAGNAAMLSKQRLGHLILVTGFLRLIFHGLQGKTVLLITGSGQAFGGFGQVFMVLGFVGTWLGRNQQTRRCTYGAVAVGAQFKAFATRLPPKVADESNSPS